MQDTLCTCLTLCPPCLALRAWVNKCLSCRLIPLRKVVYRLHNVLFIVSCFNFECFHDSIGGIFSGSTLCSNCNMHLNCTASNTWFTACTFINLQDSWSSILMIVDHFAKNQDTFIAAAGPGHWNDPDMVRIRHHCASKC